MESSPSSGVAGLLRGCAPWHLPLALFLLTFSVFCLTASTLYFGNEGPTIRIAEAWVTGTEAELGTGGVGEVATYLPGAFVKMRVIPPGRAESLRAVAHSFVQPFLAALICVVLFAFARDLYGSVRIGAALALVFAFATMAWPYSKFGMENAQTLTMLLSAWLVWKYVRQPTARTALFAGLSLGLLITTKVTAPLHALLLVGAGVWMALAAGVHRRPEFPRHVLLAFCGGLFFFAIFVISNKLRYHGWLLGARYNVGTELSGQYFWHSLGGVLVSPGKSLFLFSPPLLLALYWGRSFLRRHAALWPCAVIGLILVLWYCGFSNHFNDETWGPRRLHWLVPFLLLPVGLAFERFGRMTLAGKGITVAVLAAGVVVQLLAIPFDYTAHYFIMEGHRIYSIQNLVWLPEMNGLRMNAHLLQSWWSVQGGGPSIPYVIEWKYVPWHAPHEPPAPVSFDVAGQDVLDFWWARLARAAGEGGFWFREAASWLVFVFLAGAIAGATATGRLLRRDHSSE